MEDKRLDRLFEYTKFHIGIYLSAASGLVALIGLSVRPEGGAFINKLVGCPAALGASVVLMFVAGLAGGIIASATTKYKDYEDLWLKPQNLGILGRTWATIEHGAFRLSVITFLCSILSSCAVQKWLFSCQPIGKAISTFPE